MIEQQMKVLQSLFHRYGYLGESHLTPKKLQQRTEYFFKTTLESKLFDETTINIAFIYMKKILKRLNDKLSDKRFKCLMLSCFYYSYNGRYQNHITLKEFYESLNVFVHYITLEEAEKWKINSYFALDCNLLIGEEDFAEQRIC